VGPLVIGLIAASAAGAPFTYQSPAGFDLVVPEGFSLAHDLPQGPTGAAAPAPPGVGSEIAAVFRRNGPEGTATLLLSFVDAPLDESSGAPERLCALAMAYMKEELDADLRLEWVDHVATGNGKVIELAGRFSLLGEERVAQFAFVPMTSRHLVLMASLPQATFTVLGPKIEAALGTLRFEHKPGRGGVARASWGAALGVGLGCALLLATAWRRRKMRRAAPPHS
jgi:hypothetical protein